MGLERFCFAVFSTVKDLFGISPSPPGTYTHTRHSHNTHRLEGSVQLFSVFSFFFFSFLFFFFFVAPFFFLFLNMRSGLVTVARQRAGDAVRSQLRLQASLVALTEEVVSERVRRITDVVGPKHVAPLLEKESSSSIDHARKFSMDFGTIDFSAGEITFSNSNLYSLASTSGSLFNNSEESRIRSRMNADSFGQMSLDQRSTHLHNTLKQYFGHDHFRPGQFEVIDALLRRQHCVAILPTGHGKSLCYQLPSLVTGMSSRFDMAYNITPFAGKPTLVISPLIALMQEQATSLKLKGFDAAFSGKGVAYHQDWEELDVLFMSPEAAVLQRERLEMTDFGLIAVDEAHCVSEWGSSFRSTYRELGFLRKIHPEVPHLLITATATEMVANDIRSVFNLKDKYKLVTHSFNRYCPRPHPTHTIPFLPSKQLFHTGTTFTTPFASWTKTPLPPS